MEKRIIFKNPDGSCGVIAPAPEYVELFKKIYFKLSNEDVVPEDLYIDIYESIARKDVPFDDIYEGTGQFAIDDEGNSYEVQRFKEIKQRAWRIVNVDKIPFDRTFRNAWTDDNPTETVDVDMVKAKDIHMEKIKKAREEKFLEMGFPVKLNPELEEATISKETKDKLKALRDIPQKLDLSKADTPEKLKAIWPEQL